MFNLTSVDKAIAAGITSAVVAVAARYGFQPHPETVTAVGVVVTAVVSYVVAHVVVYFKANKSK